MQMEANERMEKWDCLVLTARNAAQRQIYEQQLTGLDLSGFCAEWFVLADKNVKGTIWFSQVFSRLLKNIL